MARKEESFRVGRVKAYLRGTVWYLYYFQNGLRKRPRVGTDKAAARLLAAQTNAQLESGAPPVLSFEAISIPVLRDRWLSHHEQVLRSSVQTIRRYRAATSHLVRFVERAGHARDASRFGVREAEDFVKYLRYLKVSPNGHPHSIKRRLLDKGIRFILEACRALFNYAARRRHLSPYAENPFAALRLDRIPVDSRRPIVLLTPEQERAFLIACDEWQFPLFLTLMLTGLRPGELAHLVLPDDVDFENRVLVIRNRPTLGWQTKTRNERQIPLVRELTEVLRVAVAGHSDGPLFLRRQFLSTRKEMLSKRTISTMEEELARRLVKLEEEGESSRDLKHRTASQLWRDYGALKNEQIRREYIRVCKKAKVDGGTSPKALRHLFATGLQCANVDPLIRMELMGHSYRHDGSAPGLGMTAVYTHTRPEVRRKQLEQALSGRPALEIASLWQRRSGELRNL